MDPLHFINGFSALALVCSAFIIGIMFLKNGIKTKGHVQFVGLALSLAVAFGWMGITITYLSVLFYGYNLPWVKGVISFFSYSTIPIGAFSVMYVTWDVAGAPKNKKIVLILFTTYSIFYYILLYATFSEAVVCFDVPAGEIYDDWISPTSMIYYILWGEVVLASGISGIGWLKFSKRSSGELKKRANLLLIASGLVGFSILADTVILMESFVYLLSIPRFAIIIGLSIIYRAFKPSK